MEESVPCSDSLHKKKKKKTFSHSTGRWEATVHPVRPFCFFALLSFLKLKVLIATLFVEV